MCGGSTRYDHVYALFFVSVLILLMLAQKVTNLCRQIFDFKIYTLDSSFGRLSGLPGDRMKMPHAVGHCLHLPSSIGSSGCTLMLQLNDPV